MTSDYITYPAPISNDLSATSGHLTSNSTLSNEPIALELDDCLSATADYITQYRSATEEQRSSINCCAAQEQPLITVAVPQSVTTSPKTGCITNTSDYITYLPEDYTSCNQSPPRHISQLGSDYISYQLPNSCGAQTAITEYHVPSNDITLDQAAHNAEDHSGYVSYQTQDYPTLHRPPLCDTGNHTVSPELDCFSDDAIGHQSSEPQNSSNKNHISGYISYTLDLTNKSIIEQLTIVGRSMIQPNLGHATSDISGSSDYITINQYPR